MRRKNVANELIESLHEAAEIAEGKITPAAVHHVPLVAEVDVRAVRAATGLAGRSLRAVSHLIHAHCKTGSRVAAAPTALRELI